MKITGKIKETKHMSLQALQDKLKTSYDISIGYPKGSPMHPGKANKKQYKPISVIDVALIQEFGTADGRIPERSTLRATINAKKNIYSNIAKKLFKKALIEKGYDLEKNVGKLGELAKSDVQKAILAFTDPPNAESTIKQKGFDAPLRDTSMMLQSVTYRVEKSKK